MVTNYLLQGRRYRPSQVVAVILVTAGIVLATLSAPPKGAPRTPSAAAADARTEALQGRFDWIYATGIAILTAALVLSALMGIWQEKTYRLYGDVWQEGLFYSVSLAPFL
jgi:UDP-xylose/UDP-N-acetylglucosamine transporter B4